MNRPFHILCTHFQTCPGCVYQSIEQPPEIFFRAESYLKKIKGEGFSLPLIKGSAKNWRTRAKLSVRASQNPKIPSIGLFQEGSHNVVEIPFCKVHHPKINETITHLKKAFEKTTLTFYDEKTHQGDLRYLQSIVERTSQKISLTLVLNCAKATAKPWIEFCKALYTEDPSFWHSFYLNFNQEKTNTIFGPTWQHIVGPECIWEKICGVDIPFGPSHFGQANLDVFEQLVKELGEHIDKKDKVVEFYAGMGVIGLTLTKHSASVTISERDKSCEPYFSLAKERLDPTVQKKLHFITGSAESELQLLHNADVCIVDPPRKGLAPKFTKALCNTTNLKKLIYVSCNFESFERDCDSLLSAFTLTSAKSYLFFPGTNHIETLAIFERK